MKKVYTVGNQEYVLIKRPLKVNNSETNNNYRQFMLPTNEEGSVEIQSQPQLGGPALDANA